MDNNDKLFDDHMFRLCLSLSILIFLFLLESHHYTPVLSTRQIYITYLATAICLDLVDTIYFLDLLWQSLVRVEAKSDSAIYFVLQKDNWNLQLWLDITILALVGVNFVLPTFALMKLRFGRFPKYFLVSDKVWALFYVLLVSKLRLRLLRENHKKKNLMRIFPLTSR
jgi:hypothetical protein